MADVRSSDSPMEEGVALVGRSASSRGDARSTRIAGGVCGVVGAVLLGVYFAAPIQLPASNATAQQIAEFVERSHDRILLGGWLQGVGSLLGVVFFLALVHAAGATDRLAGLVVLLGSAVLLALSLIQSILFI